MVDRITLEQVTKRFGDLAAVDGVSLSIAPGEIFFLLGPSGCGKSTLLRIVAGLEREHTGRVVLDGEDVTGAPPEERRLAFVFQNYALWPHMTVAQNVSFGLEVRRVPPSERRERVARMLDIVGIGTLHDRYPHQLSGGQQQRVALARGLVVEPRILLLDEPFSNLDAGRRRAMRDELAKLRDTLGLTILFVTHDQEEALALGDRIAVMARGRMMEMGSPRDLYHAPRTEFVASFLGERNLAPAHLEPRPDGFVARSRFGRGSLVGVDPSRRIAAMVRPERCVLEERESSGGPLMGVVRRITFLGSTERIEVGLDDGGGVLVSQRSERTSPWTVGARVRVRIEGEDVVLLERSSDES